MQSRETYERMKGDLTKQIELCYLYKEQIQNALQELKEQYESGFIDEDAYNLKVNKFLKGRTPQDWYSIYDDHIAKCHQNIGHYNEKINELSRSYNEKRNSFSRIFMIIGILFFILGIFFFVQPTITGLISFEEKPEITFEDGYTKEGYKWMEIKGSRIYERCLQVNSEIDFNSINIIAKVTRATDNRDLALALYRNDDTNDEPLELLGSCKVSKYGVLMKSCAIDGLQESQGQYWVCASSTSGDPSTTYYTIAYQNGDLRRTALWTGENWQKLDGLSYTMKAEFIQNE